MINAMAQQQVYTVPVYSGTEAAYGHFPQYVTQVSHGAYIATAAPQAVLSRSARDPYESLHIYEETARHRERRDHRDRDRDRRDRDREREYRDRRDRDRDRERRDRDKDRDRDRDRDRERDRDRDRERYRDDDRDRSPRSRDRDYRDRDYDRDKDSLYDDDVRGIDYKNMPPNNTIMVRGLAQHITENDIRADILACNLMPKDIRLVRKKESGASRGFAFVEFTTVHDATRWMEAKQGVLILQDVYRATLQYSIPKEAADKQNKQSQDWFCMCGAHNFKRRDSCFKCSTPRHESEVGLEGSDEICNYPTNLLLLRGLDVLSTEEAVLLGIEAASSDLPIRSVRIGRDPLTNTSRGVCYIELNSVLDSMQLYNKLTAYPPIIDNKQATVSYCRLNQNVNQSSGQQHQPIEYTAGADIKKLAEYSASVYAQTPEEHASYVEYYTMYYQQQQAQISSGTQSDSVNAAAAVAQSALQAMQQKVSGNSAVAAATVSQVNYSTTVALAVSSATTDTTSTSSASANYEATPSDDSTDYPKYPPPDVSTYTYDEASGYYYDPSTGLFYDATSTYYYNSETGQYLYWDAERSTYMPSPCTDDMQDGSNPGFKDKKEKQEKQDKVKVAKKIAKDMERWAKAQNKRNETVSKPLTEPIGGNVGEGLAGSGAADAAFAVLLERRERTTAVDKPSFQMHMNTPSIVNNLKKSGLVAAYGGEGSDSEEEKEVPESSEKQEEKIVDLVKMACLLCKRQFPNRDMLNKHVQLSNLHKSNLEAFRKKAKEAAAIVQAQYRDRAKERRDKYGQPNGPPPNKLKERYMAAREEVEATSTEEVSRDSLGDNSVASKLMKKMGWSDGMGLGKSNQGRTKIIEAERRVSTAGLGMQGANYSVAGDSYKDCVKKMMLHRYQELDAIEKSTGKR